MVSDPIRCPQGGPETYLPSEPFSDLKNARKAACPQDNYEPHLQDFRLHRPTKSSECLEQNCLINLNVDMSTIKWSNFHS